MKPKWCEWEEDGQCSQLLAKACGGAAEIGSRQGEKPFRDSEAEIQLA